MAEVVNDAGAADAPLEYSGATARTRRLLRGPVGSVLFWLALPVLCEQLLNLLVALTDTFLAGTISKDATAAIGLDVQVDWLAGLLFGFIGIGATALVSRHAGAGDEERANHFANQALIAAAAIGLFACVLVQVAAPLLPRFLGWGPGPAQIAITFLRIDAFGYMVFTIAAIGNFCWRGMGDTRTPLYVMSVVNIVNMSVSAALRFGVGPIPAIGAPGIAIGTVVARVVGGLLVLILLLRGRSGLKLRLRHLRICPDSMRRLLWVGVPGGIDGTLLWCGLFGYLLIISHLATGADQAATLAAHFVGIRAEALSYLPAFAFAAAASTMVGQSLGGRDFRRARLCGHLAAAQAGLICAGMGVLFFVFAPQIYHAFNQNADAERVAAIGVPAMKLLAFFQVPQALMIVYVNALRGAGDTRYPLLFTIVGVLGVRLSIGYLCGIVLQGGLVGAWVGMYADVTIRCMLAMARFFRGKWQHIQV